MKKFIEGLEKHLEEKGVSEENRILIMSAVKDFAQTTNNDDPGQGPTDPDPED